MIPVIAEWTTKSRWTSSTLWLGVFLLISHLMLSFSATDTLHQYQRLHHEFQESWNTGVAAQLADQGITPDKAEESARRKAWLTPHVQSHILYGVWIMPYWFHWKSLILSWLFQPSWFALFMILFFLPWIGTRLENHFGSFYSLLLLLGSAILSNSFYWILVSLFGSHGEHPYMGFGSALAFGFGLNMALDKKAIQVYTPGPGGISIRSLNPWIWFVVYAILDLVLNGWIHPSPYRFTLFINILVMGLSYYFAPKLLILINPAPKKAAPKHAQGQANQDHLKEGWRLAELLELEAAAHELQQGISGLLRSSNPEFDNISQIIDRIATFKSPIPIETQVWYQWGERLETLQQPALSIQCLEQMLQSPVVQPLLARPAALKIAEQRLRHRMNPEKAVSILQKVCQYSTSDLIGNRAKKLLQEITPQNTPGKL